MFPQRSANIINAEFSRKPSAPKLVERKFKFPNFYDPNGASVEQLGHHAGYYQLQHSHNARFVFGYSNLFSSLGDSRFLFSLNIDVIFMIYFLKF